MSHVDFIIIVQKLHLEGQSVVKATAFFLQRILKITNVSSISVPSDALAILLVSRLFRVQQRFHTLVVRAFWLNQINKIEFVSDPSSCVS
jgi:hypothetical protein